MRHVRSETKTELGYTLIKQKLWNGYSWPLKRSIFDAHVLSAGIQSIPNLAYIALDNHRILLSAHRGFIHIYMVPSDTRKLCEELLISFGLPELCRRFATPEKIPSGSAPRQVVHDDSCDFELCRYENRLLLRILLPTYKPREPQRYAVSELGKLNPTARSG